MVTERSSVFHAPCGSCSTPCSATSLLIPRYIVTWQMVDKVWYDWQNKSPRNKYAYGGGSVSALPSYQNFSVFTTGFPPYLNVSARFDFKGTASHILHPSTSLIAKSPVTVFGPTLRSGIFSIQRGIRCAILMHRCW